MTEQGIAQDEQGIEMTDEGNVTSSTYGFHSSTRAGAYREGAKRQKVRAGLLLDPTLCPGVPAGLIVGSRFGTFELRR